MVLTILCENDLADFKLEPSAGSGSKPIERWFAKRYLPNS
jgi:hypothetical protein